MENNFLLTEEKLWEYAEGLLDEPEFSLVQKYVQQHPKWAHQLEAMKRESALLKTMPVEKPDTGFSDRVMAAWAGEQFISPATIKSAKPDWVLRAIAVAFGLFILIPVLFLWNTALPGFEYPTQLNAYFQIPRMANLNWIRFLTNGTFQLSAVCLLALIFIRLLERYFHQKRIVGQLRMKV